MRAALDERLGALAIRTEVVEHPEVRGSCRRGGLRCGVLGGAVKTRCPSGNVPQKRPF